MLLRGKAVTVMEGSLDIWSEILYCMSFTIEINDYFWEEVFPGAGVEISVSIADLRSFFLMYK